MRIVSGSCKGRTIVPPKHLQARPTTDFAKENLFNIISNRYDYEELSVLDLFSGTGSISYEFASRGADRVVSIEQNTLHQSFIQQTSKKLELTQISSFKANAFTFIKSCREKFDIVFADPPYDLEGIDSLPDFIIERGLLKEDGIFIFEHSKNKKFDNHPCFREHRSYGSVNFTFFAMAKNLITP